MTNARPARVAFRCSESVLRERKKIVTSRRGGNGRGKRAAPAGIDLQKMLTKCVVTHSPRDEYVGEDGREFKRVPRRYARSVIDRRRSRDIAREGPL